jgi:hypothetical protein
LTTEAGRKREVTEFFFDEAKRRDAEGAEEDGEQDFQPQKVSRIRAKERKEIRGDSIFSTSCTPFCGPIPFHLCHLRESEDCPSFVRRPKLGYSLSWI